MEQAAEETIPQFSSAIEQGSLNNQDPVDPELGLMGRTNHQIYPKGHNTGWIGSVVELALGTKKSDPIWRLRLLAAITLVTAMIGVFVLPGYFQRVMLVTTVGVPIIVAVISLFVSFWLASDGQNNWITGLSVANVSILVGDALALPLYFVLKRGTGN